MAFYGELFRKKDEEDIWEELKQMLLNSPSEQEITLKKQEEQVKINAALERMFPDLPKQQTEPYLNHEELFGTKKQPMGESTGMAAPPNSVFGQIPFTKNKFDLKNNFNELQNQPMNILNKNAIEDFGQKVVRGLDKIKVQNPLSDIENIMQKKLNNNNNSIQNASSNQNLTWQEKAFDKLLQNKTTVRGHFPVAADMYTDARTNFSRARANKNATVLENMNSLDSKTQEALKKYGVKSNERGVYYNTDSNVSKKFGKSKELKRAFDKNYQNIKDGNFKGADLNFDATPLDAITNKDKFDRHSSIQHAKLYDAYIDEQGHKRAQVLDNVDYNIRPDDTIKDKIKNYPNNHGYSLQEKGALENYFTLMDINVEEDDWLDKLRKKLGI